MAGKTKWVVLGLALIGGAVVATKTELRTTITTLVAKATKPEPPPAPPAAPLAPAVTVATVAPHDFTDAMTLTGTLMPREEVLVGAQIDGLQITKLDADQGDVVKKDQVLAELATDNLQSQLAQNDAALARADASVSQAQSQIAQIQASVTQTSADLRRIIELRKSPAFAQATYDQRLALANGATAQLKASGDALVAAKADRMSQIAQRRQLEIKMGQTRIVAPLAGLISERNAQVGAIAMGAGGPLFRIIRNGAIELNAEVPEQDIARLSAGLRAEITPAGGKPVMGSLRLLSPDVDQATRLGHVRISVDDPLSPAAPNLRSGAFARARIVLAQRHSLGVPASAVATNKDGSNVLVVHEGVVERRKVTVGVTNGDLSEIEAGLASGDIVVAKAAGFLRNGDAVRAMPAPKSGDAS